MSKRLECVVIFTAQILIYSIICINFRAIAQTDYLTAITSDIILASLNFYLIRKIVTSEDSTYYFISYVTGSAIGSYLGIYISTLLK